MSEQTALIVLELTLDKPEDLWKAVDKISSLELPLVIGGNHIAINETASEIKKLLASNDKISYNTFYNEQTLFKVNKALRVAGLTQVQTQDAIIEMQNAGILFRERL